MISTDTPSRAPGGWRSQAFGLNLRGDFDAPGLARRTSAGAPAPPVHITVADGPATSALWPENEAERLLHWRVKDGENVMTVDHHPDLGYRLYALHQGTYFVAGDGASITCVPPAVDSWVWQRFLVGQVLPLAAVINGFEVLHASAVTVAGRGVAFAAKSGEGKTSLALNLVLRGAGFLTDDVAAVSLRDDQPIVHPGPGLTNLRREEDACLGGRRALLGEVIGSDHEGLRLALRREPQPTPLAALYFLERVPEGDAVQCQEIDDVSFGSLVECGYTRFVSTPARVHRQLVVYAAIAERVRVFRLCSPPAVTADVLSAFVESHVVNDL